MLSILEIMASAKQTNEGKESKASSFVNLLNMQTGSYTTIKEPQVVSQFYIIHQI